MALEFRVLGPLEVRRSGIVADLGSPKQRAVLGLLLAVAPDVATIDDLVDQVWGAAGPADPLRSLQVYVSALRKVLGGPGAVVAAGGGYRLALDDALVDATEFETAALRAGRLLEQREAEDARRLALSALARWRGDAWQDLRHLSRVEPVARRLDELRTDTEVLAARAALETGRHREVVGRLEALVRQHPLHEGLLELLMLALHRSGRRADALAAFSRGRVRLVEETGLDPGEPVTRLQQAILLDEPTLRVEDAELRARRHLPAQVTSLVGREDEVEEIAAELAEHRLLTLVGTGGVGKTRLALRVAHEAAANHPDGVWFVDLAAVMDPATVAQAIAEAVGLEAPEDIETALESWVRDRRALLVLDNFEQVEEAAPLVTGLLGGADGLRVLVTSRVRLRVYGEHVHPVEPLGLDSAARLFAERARSVAPWLDTSRERDVLDLCTALDGLPLAIELVAARADEVDLDGMLHQLGHLLELASGGPRDRAERQRSLRAAIDWSVRLLDPAAARAFARLGVFVGGFTEAAAATVTDPDQLPVLLRASLVTRVDGRYRMLESIREHAEECTADELLAVREAHARWCLDLASEAAAGLARQRRRWIGVLRAELGNLRAALTHLAEVAADDDPPGSRLLRLAVDLAAFWFRTAPASEDVEWLTRALAAAPDAPPVQRARALYGLTICHGEQGETERAIEFGRQALELLPPGVDDAWRARALNSVAGLTRDLGRAAEALPLMEESLELRRSVVDETLTVLIPLLNLSLAATDLGDHARCRELLAEAATVARDEGELALINIRVASAALDEGDPVEAAALLASVVPVLRSEEERYRLIEALDQLAALAVLQGKPREAAVLLAAADRSFADDGVRLVPAETALRERRTGAALRALDRDELAAARSEGAALDLDAALDRAFDALGLR